MKKIFITGGTGFVGANLVRRMAEQGHEVHLLVRKESQLWRLADIRETVTLHTVDITEYHSLEVLFRQFKPDWVFHLATYGAYPYRRGIPYQQNVIEMIKTNIISTVQLLKASAMCDVEVFVNTGSSSEYGTKNHPMSENGDILAPIDTYGATKASSALITSAVAMSLNMRWVHLRLFSVYGPYEEQARLIPTVLLGYLRREALDLANPLSVRDFIYADDVVSAFEHVASKQIPNGIYNVGSGVQHSVEDVVQHSSEIFGYSTLVNWGQVNSKPNEPINWVADNSKLVKTGWEPKYTLKTGLETVAGWFKNNEGFYS